MLRSHYDFDTKFRLLANILSTFCLKPKFENVEKSIGAFEKQADDVASGGSILPKISEVVRK